MGFDIFQFNSRDAYININGQSYPGTPDLLVEYKDSQAVFDWYPISSTENIGRALLPPNPSTWTASFRFTNVGGGTITLNNDFGIDDPSGLSGITQPTQTVLHGGQSATADFYYTTLDSVPAIGTIYLPSDFNPDFNVGFDLTFEPAVYQMIYSDSNNGTTRLIDFDLSGSYSSVSTFAGTARTYQGTDGLGASARFYRPTGSMWKYRSNMGMPDMLVCDGHGVRHIVINSSDWGMVMTYPGDVFESGSFDGPLDTGLVRFNSPSGVVMTPDLSTYCIADAGNFAIRTVIAGVASTLAGEKGSRGHVNGNGNEARFYDLTGVTLGKNSNDIFVGEYDSTNLSAGGSVRRVTLSGTVTTPVEYANSYPVDVVSTTDGYVYVHLQNGENWRFSEDELVHEQLTDSGLKPICESPVIGSLLVSKGHQIGLWYPVEPRYVPLAGDEILDGFGDGVGPDARFGWDAAPVPVIARVPELYAWVEYTDGLRAVFNSVTLYTTGSLLWTFGDGQEEVLTYFPTEHIYAAAGSYNVSISGGGAPAVYFTVDVVEIPTYPPSILSDPTNVSTTAGNVMVFTVEASGTEPLYYQWYWSDGGDPQADGTDMTLSAMAEESWSGRTYWCDVTNAYGTATSAQATLTVGPYVPPSDSPVITSDPSNSTVTSGDIASFTVEATGTEPLYYQWYWSDGGDPMPIDGSSITTTLSFTTDESQNGRTYWCDVSNGYGTATSVQATLTVLPLNGPPVITQNPSNTTVASGEIATFSVVATGPEPIYYQWYWSLDGGPVQTDGTGWYISFTTDETQNGRTYWCDVENAYGYVTSATATLTIDVNVPTPTPTPTPSVDPYATHILTLRADVSTGGVVDYGYTDSGGLPVNEYGHVVTFNESVDGMNAPIIDGVCGHLQYATNAHWSIGTPCA